jgi:pimeloyl-ACP methyl ester carboxylesterase
MKIYAIAGLGTDERVFRNLSLDYPVHMIKWIDPKPNENLEEYAYRISIQINTKEDFVLIGVSFGGMLAIALQRFLQPKLTVLISSARNKYDLPVFYKWIGKTKLLELIPHSWMKLPKGIVVWLFDARQKELLLSIIEDTDLHFLKWALIAISRWKEEQIYDVLSIHGTKDKLIPFPKGVGTILIKNAGHFMIVDNAEALSKILKENIKNIKKE